MSPTGVVVRVVVFRGRRAVAHSKTFPLGGGPRVHVVAALRGGTVRSSPGAVRTVTGDPAGIQTITLARGARVPRVGGALVVDATASRPGILGIVTAVKRRPGVPVVLTTRPGTLQDAYSSFDVHINESLGQLASGAKPHSVRGRAAVALGPFDASFHCDRPDVQHSITHSINLSPLRFLASITIPSYKNGFAGPGINLLLTGQPTLDFGVTFSGKATCKGDANATFPIPDTPLEVTIGPKFELHADGAVGVNFAWDPRIGLDLDRFRGGPNDEYATFKSVGSTTFTGVAGLTLSLALSTSLSLDKRVGITGTIGPQITGTATTHTNPARACLDVNGEMDADLQAFAKTFFKDYSFTLGHFAFLRTRLYHDCSLAPPPPVPRPIFVTNPGDQTSTVGNPVRLQIQASDTDGGALTYSATGLPAGLSINPSTGMITGTPTTAGISSVTVVAADATGPTASTTFTWTIGTNSGGAQAITAGGFHSCALLTTGGVDCWGDDLYGELGNGTNTGPDTCGSDPCSTTPMAVTGITNATAITAGYDHTCARLSTGGIKCWGDNAEGELGDGTTSGADSCDGASDQCSTTPVAVSGIATANAITAGRDHTCALLATGEIKCWGYNFYGQLGNGNNTGPDCLGACNATAVAVSGITNATAITAGFDHTCALLATGRIDCWGDNADGELGNGTNTGPDTCGGSDPCSTTPVAVSGISNAIAITAGGNHTCALLATGGVACWGYNFYGQLGDGTTNGPDACGSDSCSTTPVAVSGLTTAAAITAGGAHTCALLTTGGIDCWGDNAAGELGDGIVTGPDCLGFCDATPVAVSGIRNATAITADGNLVGEDGTCALLTTGGIECWGDGGDGELGNGTNVMSATPVAVTGFP